MGQYLDALIQKKSLECLPTVPTKPIKPTNGGKIGLIGIPSTHFLGKNIQPEGYLKKTAKERSTTDISNILSGLYRQKSANEWEWLRLNKPDWWQCRIELENEVDGYFLDGKAEAAQEAFYQLVAHLKAAPIDKLSSRIARQLDGADPRRPEIPTKTWKPMKLPGHPEAWDGTRISGRKYYNLPQVKKQQHKK